MGWGLNAALRSEVLGASAVAGVYKPGTSGCTAIVDMCATLRFHTMHTCTAYRVVASLMKKLAGCDVVILHYDDNRVSCPLRDELHQKRYKAPSASGLAAAATAGKTIVGGRAYKKGTEPMAPTLLSAIQQGDVVDWQRLWSSSAGKAKIYTLVHGALEGWCKRHCSHAVLSWLGDAKFVYPFTGGDAGLLEHTRYPFQEADQRVCWSVALLRAGGYGGRVVVHTCDTDMVLQMTASDVGAAETAVQFRGWWLDVRRLRAMMGSSQQERLSSCFWMIAAGGCDYCPSLTTWGYTSRVLAVNVSARPAVDFDDVHGSALRGLSTVALRSSTKRKRVSLCDEEEYVRRARHCVRLFACESAPVGGPAWDATESV